MLTDESSIHNDTQHECRVRCVAGTMALDGITMSDASRCNIERYATRHATYTQIIEEIKAKYRK